MDQIQVDGAPALNNWPLRQTGSFVLLFLPPGYQSCGPGAPGGIGQSCSPPQGSQCAYHSYSTAVFQANIDYGTVIFPDLSNKCEWYPFGGAQFGPVTNGAIHLASHELSEGITDPDVKGWCGPSGFTTGLGCIGDSEIADKCEYVQDRADTIAGVVYDLPLLWNDVSHRCE
jgi:hypothetical protein